MSMPRKTAVEPINTMKAAKRFEKIAERYTKEILATPGGAREALIRVGVLNKHGKRKDAHK